MYWDLFRSPEHGLLDESWRMYILRLLGIVFSRYQLDKMTDSISKIFVLAEFWREWGGEMAVLYCWDMS